MGSDGSILVKQFGLWGHVCSPTWTHTEASAVCQTLGHYAGAALTGGASNTRLPYWVDGMNCPAGADNVSDCQITLADYHVQDGSDYSSCDGRRAVCYEQKDGKSKR